MQKLKIVLLYASIGSGHKRAAQAMEEAFSALNSTNSIQSLDIMEFLPRKLVRFFLRVYFFSLRQCPNIYESIYQWGNRREGVFFGREIMRRYFAHKLKRLFKNNKPDIIVSTHAAAASAADYWIRQEGPAVCHVGIVTDFTIHRFWVNETITCYFVYDKAMLSPMVRNWINEDKICQLGIPVLKKFEADCSYLKASGNKTVLIMGGGEGLVPMLPILEMLDRVSVSLCILVVTGHNKVLQEQLLARKHMFRQQLCVMGFVDEIASLMRRADLLITKAGGVSVSEALLIGVPLFLYRPLPGQERINADFLLRCGVAKEIKSIASITAEVDKMFGTDDTSLRQLQINIKSIAKTQAAENIACYIINKLYNRTT